MLPAVLTTFLFSISAVSGQRASKLLGGIDANLWRLVLATLLLALAAHSFGAGMAGQAFPIFFVSGCIGFGIGDIALYQAFPRIGSRLSVLLVLCLSAPLAAAVEWIWLGTSLSAMEIVAGCTILVGVILALAPGKHLEVAQARFASGILFGLFASICQGLGAVISRKAFAVAQGAGENIDGMTAAYQRILGGLAVAALSAAIIKRSVWTAAWQRWCAGAGLISAERKPIWRSALPWILVNALTGSVLGVSCYQWALKTTPTGIVLPIVAATPLVIIPFSRYVEGERPTRRSLAGGIIAVAGAVVLALVKTS